eukprot:4780819-Pyramimonas_sp.AAC.1
MRGSTLRQLRGPRTACAWSREDMYLLSLFAQNVAQKGGTVTPTRALPGIALGVLYVLTFSHAFPDETRQHGPHSSPLYAQLPIMLTERIGHPQRFINSINVPNETKNTERFAPQNTLMRNRLLRIFKSHAQLRGFIWRDASRPSKF